MAHACGGCSATACSTPQVRQIHSIGPRYVDPVGQRNRARGYVLAIVSALTFGAMPILAVAAYVWIVVLFVNA